MVLIVSGAWTQRQDRTGFVTVRLQIGINSERQSYPKDRKIGGMAVATFYMNCGWPAHCIKSWNCKRDNNRISEWLPRWDRTVVGFDITLRQRRLWLVPLWCLHVSWHVKFRDPRRQHIYCYCSIENASSNLSSQTSEWSLIRYSAALLKHAICRCQYCGKADERSLEISWRIGICDGYSW